MSDQRHTPTLPRISPHAMRPAGILVQPNSADEIDRLTVKIPFAMPRRLHRQLSEHASRQRMTVAGLIRTLIERELETPAP